MVARIVWGRVEKRGGGIEHGVLCQ